MSLFLKIDARVDRNLDLPIAFRKGTRTCTQQPLYLLSNFLSFEKKISVAYIISVAFIAYADAQTTNY